jgi:hypothetical protein
MTELSFLLELLLNHKLPGDTKKLIHERINEVSSAVIAPSQAPPEPRLPSSQFKIKPMEPLNVPVDQIAQTPAAQAALELRQQMINQAAREGFSGRASIKSHSTPPGSGR